MINRAKLQHILEYAKQQRHIGLHCKVPPEDMVEIVEMAMLQGAESAESRCGNSPVIPEELLSAMEEVLRISDRDHDAWHRARAAIAKCRQQ